jgi:hypothetical protein
VLVSQLAPSIPEPASKHIQCPFSRSMVLLRASGSRHYSGTFLEAEEGTHVGQRRKLARSHVRLEDGSRLLQTARVRWEVGAQLVLVVALVDGAIG